MAKILEVGINKRLLRFFNEYNIFTDRQYAYRPGRSTTALVRELVWKITGALEEMQQVAVVCCDLSRASDTADRLLLQEKLDYYGVRGPAAKFMSDFVTERCQVVVGDSGRVQSNEGISDLGVPQGSCLSNTTFSLLLNDLPNSIDGAEIYMFADDVAAVVTAPTTSDLKQKLSDVTKQLCDWFRINGLALNLDKTREEMSRKHGMRSKKI
ncbi:RNA-directed DNA polymerase from mobile element jockey [Operophtera brumata]|uniref:RNA-directed DNA polymerase from mobile element jockey n=1 Tax=Operophtera brumata TaxID=104452 RepID=A0A0L7L0D8_OPEBR|nr:RNA-directed DNA polymerase from mobile element jockey [Operophtera brumata]